MLDPNVSADPIPLSRSSRLWRMNVGLELPDRPTRVLATFDTATIHEEPVSNLGGPDPAKVTMNRGGVDTGPTIPLGERPRWMDGRASGQLP
jgi:hypothetical protein